MINEGLSSLIRALLFKEKVQIFKVQPPDGIVIRLTDGSLWSIQAYRLKEEEGV